MSSDENEPQETTKQQNRRSTKPFMEKKRRARINASLTELKSLLLEVMKKEGARHNKMEKADILEMTVRHLRQIQRSRFSAAASTDPATVNKFHIGYNECANEVSRYLGAVDGLDVELRARLLNHLANCITETSSNLPNASHPQNSPSSSGVSGSGFPYPQSHGVFPVAIAPKVASLPMEINNNTIQLPVTVPLQQLHQAYPNQVNILGGVQILPSKLVGGDITFLVPGNFLGGEQFGNCFIPVRDASQLTITREVADKMARSSVIVASAPQQPQPPSATVTQASEEPVAISNQVAVKEEASTSRVGCGSGGHSAVFSAESSLPSVKSPLREVAEVFIQAAAMNGNSVSPPEHHHHHHHHPREEVIRDASDADENNNNLHRLDVQLQQQQHDLQEFGPMWRPW